MPTLRLGTAALAPLVMTLLVAVEAQAQSRSESRARSAAESASASSPSFDHTAFDRLLTRHVDQGGLVDYAAFEDEPAFDEYLSRLASADVEALDADARLALWINAYNAWTIELINREDRPESIKDINKTLGFIPTGGAWRVRFAEVAGETWTLDEIEHEVIRERFDEPRIHFALVCAAIGCPPLRAGAYTGGQLDRQLDEQARAFLLDSPGKNRVDAESARVHLSPIFDWYEEDFGDGREDLGRYLAQWFEGDEAELLRSGDFRVDYTDYDWSLNIRR